MRKNNSPGLQRMEQNNNKECDSRGRTVVQKEKRKKEKKS